jgi:Cof subfamily protein (haloacid dehalogenase superfamily)
LDDTLLGSDGAVSPANREWLQRWRAAGRHLVVATGRPPRSIPEALPEEHWDVPWICYNGAEIRIQGQSVFQDLMEARDARAVVDHAQQVAAHWRLGVELDDTLYLNRPSPRPGRFTVVDDLVAVVDRPSPKVLMINDHFRPPAGNGTAPEPDDALIFADLQPVLAALPARTYALLSGRYRLAQVLSRSADKGNALHHLVASWGLSMAEVAAIGDDVNDVGMVQQAGLGVAVANAVPQVRAVADRVTGSNDEDGVAQVIRMLME